MTVHGKKPKKKVTHKAAHPHHTAIDVQAAVVPQPVLFQQPVPQWPVMQQQQQPQQMVMAAPLPPQPYYYQPQQFALPAPPPARQVKRKKKVTFHDHHHRHRDDDDDDDNYEFSHVCSKLLRQFAPYACCVGTTILIVWLLWKFASGFLCNIVTAIPLIGSGFDSMCGTSTSSSTTTATSAATGLVGGVVGGVTDVVGGIVGGASSGFGLW